MPHGWWCDVALGLVLAEVVAAVWLGSFAIGGVIRARRVERELAAARRRFGCDSPWRF